MRIAFLTDEYATDLPTAGGLGRYLLVMTRALQQEGHEVEVFCRSPHRRDSTQEAGVWVHRVPEAQGLPRALAYRLGRLNWRMAFPRVEYALAAAWSLARALRQRHAHRPFDLVQSSNTSLSGLFVPRTGWPPHLVRLSSARDLWAHTDRILRRDNRRDLAVLAQLERQQARRATVAYAPSRFLADYLQRVHNLPVRVLRPAVKVPLTLAEEAPTAPPRYLIHFGSLMRRKGTDLVLRALRLAWEREPALTLVMAGRALEPELLAGCGDPRLVVTEPLPRPQLHRLVQGACASVLPSRVDNFPNTVIESLSLGVGVIGMRGGSVEELVEPERGGRLVPMGDVAALASVMVEAWRGVEGWLRAPARVPQAWEHRTPEVAARELVALACSLTRTGGGRKEAAERY